MPKLRVTATLSLLTLAIGTAGTAWLTELTEGRADAPAVGHRVAHALAVHRHHEHTIKRPVVVQRQHYASAIASATPAAPANADDTLVPISTPTTSLPGGSSEDHATGNVVLHLVVDGQGDVTQASIAQSSGDHVLDANAMEIARHWRFAVPMNHPQGVSGDLTLRFTGQSAS
ncbi:energy transducer TonB [Dyella sp. 2HG41-7]|uniref:energy transducer TonB n=1 Tax=Dyella sp. 2HG41-7 TaxID=2883239 RepID=UPI001F311FA9|nr:energy transducer TonB [Dyella sp. 2HG41-7]